MSEAAVGGRRWMFLIAALLLACPCAQRASGAETLGAPAVPQAIPKTHGTTFAGTPVDLPDALRGKVGLLVIGFSQDAREATTAWGKRVAPDYYDSPTVACYEIAILASVPKLLRGFVEGRIKAAVSDRGKPHFLPVFDHEPEWRAAAHYGAADSAYILVVDGQGKVRWQIAGTAGSLTDASYAELRHQVDEALRSRTTGAPGQ